MDQIDRAGLKSNFLGSVRSETAYFFRAFFFHFFFLKLIFPTYFPTPLGGLTPLLILLNILIYNEIAQRGLPT